mmetsp:Transcript_4667/g.7226  ORF Transcript_4667/g.7226 Transcript_4667/m.7226 type:complete len:426 (+) Transcript_4667:148-1425(+)|eukprot:CAMPEP_0184644810 /NCGR_PEP_ID=MMETSP0308-20130426/1447_1 /TAXON_ID=38269 /ORGANISM="Gloeochaete witrockiana, Strain SAG 46.84" /LENGTH=425 /DNA_ID=CAMNT_0027073519 /DNA_START=100 /DNA_END=1377 /DNA_ORIENTATION=+
MAVRVSVLVLSIGVVLGMCAWRAQARNLLQGDTSTVPAPKPPADTSDKVLQEKLAVAEKSVAEATTELTTLKDRLHNMEQRAISAEATLQQKEGEITNLQASKQAAEEAKSQFENDLTLKMSELESSQKQLESTQKQNAELAENIKILSDTLKKAEDYMNDPSVADAFQKQLSKAMKAVPSLGLNGTMSYIGGAFSATKSSLHTKLSRYGPIARHASVISEVVAYIIFGVPFLACFFLSSRIRVNVHHLLTFGNLFFTTFSITLFALSIGMPVGPKDPLTRVSHDRGIYISLAVVYLGHLTVQMYAVITSLVQPSGGSRLDITLFAQIISTVITGGHYYAQVWYWGMKDREAKLRSGVWYLAYAVVFGLLSIVSYRRLSSQQQNEIRRILFTETGLAPEERKEPEMRRISIEQVEEDEKEEGKSA